MTAFLSILGCLVAVGAAYCINAFHHDCVVTNPEEQGRMLERFTE